ncbi:MAG: MscL family protein, partial [Actinomyces sp.]
MIKGFKEFIAQGNALELAVAVIIGAAFSPIVDAITKVIMTILGQIIGQPNFDSVGQFKLIASATEFVQP